MLTRIPTFLRVPTFLTKLGTLALVGYVAWLGWENLGPHKPEAGPVRRQLADELVATIADDIRVSQPVVRQAALLHFENDPSDYFTDRLRAVIEQNGTFNLTDRTAADKLRNVLQLRHPAYGSKDDACTRGRKLGVPGVIYGTIYSFESFSGGAKIDVDVTVADPASDDVIFQKRYSKDTTLAALAGPAVQEKMAKVPWVTRGLAWLVVVMLLPVFTIGFIRTMVRKESNRVNGFTLAIYTIADAILAFLLVGAALTWWLPVVVFAAAVAAALAYNVKVMGWAVRMEQ
ncbi:MAG TPA: hypothetical protein VM223_28515 [Planctomycetota bacterium]|nr:hypothetical protein [Planctomycetota bacterium]